MVWLCLGAAFVVLIVLAIIAENRGRDTRGEWAVRYHCSGCDRRYRATFDNRFFLDFTVCSRCGTDKEEFKRGVCRLVDGEWQDREDAERVAKVLMDGE